MGGAALRGDVRGSPREATHKLEEAPRCVPISAVALPPPPGMRRARRPPCHQQQSEPAGQGRSPRVARHECCTRPRARGRARPRRSRGANFPSRHSQASGMG